MKEKKRTNARGRLLSPFFLVAVAGVVTGSKCVQ